CGLGEGSGRGRAHRGARTRGQRAQHRGADGARRRARGGDRDPCHRARRHGRRAGAGCGAGGDAVVKVGLAGLQKVGGALMLPIAVLPIAGLLLRLGQPDLLDSASVAAAGEAIFSNLGLPFAIGVAVGLARENHGAAGLASVVAYLVATRGAEVLIAVPPDAVADLSGRARELAAAAYKTRELAKLSVPTRILSGLSAGALYNRFYDIKLPSYLAFLRRRPSVPTASRLPVLLRARPFGSQRRGAIGGLLGSIAVTSILTGVTEPIEFTFVFLAPALYGVHALLTGVAFIIMNALHVKLGFGFSAGLFDYVLNYSRATRPLWLLPVGLLYFALYYGLFRLVIVRLDLKDRKSVV